MKPTIKTALYIVILAVTIFFAKPISRKVLKTYNGCTAYVANHIVRMS